MKKFIKRRKKDEEEINWTEPYMGALDYDGTTQEGKRTTDEWTSGGEEGRFRYNCSELTPLRVGAD